MPLWRKERKICQTILMDIFPRPKTKIPGDSENNFSEPYNIFLFSNLFYCQEKFTRYFCAAFIPFGRILWLKWNLRETNIRVLAWVHILEKINKNFIVFKSFFNTKMISLLGSYLRYLFWINFNFPFCSFWQGRYLPERLFRLERSHYSASLS